MPFYRYSCCECKDEIEVFHSMNSVYEETCKQCGKPMEKQPNLKVTVKQHSDVGNLVKDFIAENKQIIQEEKILSRKDYKK